MGHRERGMGNGERKELIFYWKGSLVFDTRELTEMEGSLTSPNHYPKM